LRDLASELQTAQTVGWSSETPGMALVGQGKHSWPLSSAPSPETIAIARHAATADDGAAMADLATLASRAQGRRTWGVLRGDVDNLGIRLRRVQTIEEHVQLSVMYKQFFAGELELICSLPDYWRKVSILYSGGDDFAVYGSWDALIPLAREIQRLFHRFSEENLKDIPGPEGKTITMAVAIARDSASTLASVYELAGQMLELAKSTDRDCVFVLGHSLEWRQLAAASDLRETILRMAAELDSPRRFLVDLTAFYRKAAAASRSGTAGRHFEKPWQVQRYLSRALGETHDRELQRLRTHLTNEILVKGAAHTKLRPGGQVALEWARLLAEV
jgi:CRISPR-associated protein Csm1